jgi:hypothetical protein
MRLCEILCQLWRLFGKFFGYTHPSDAQFSLICLKKSQPPERTFPGRAAPLKRTFGRLNAPEKRAFRVILQDLTKYRVPEGEMYFLRFATLHSAARGCGAAYA